MQFLPAIWKILHMTKYFYTGTARGARNNYQVWVLYFGFLLHTRGDKITTRNTTEAFLRLSTDIFTLAFFFFARCLYVCRHRFCGCYRFQVLMLASVHVLQQISLPICFKITIFHLANVFFLLLCESVQCAFSILSYFQLLHYSSLNHKP